MFLITGRMFLKKVILQGGNGLKQKCHKEVSGGAAFRFQFLQRFLYGPADLEWRPLACTILNRLGRFGLNRSLFLIDLKQQNIKELPVFLSWTV